MRPEVPPRTKPLEIKLKRAKIPDHYLSMAESLDRMVTQVPEERVFPTPTQVEGLIDKVPGCDGTPIVHAAKETYHSSANGQVRIVTPAPKKDVVPTPTKTPLKEVQIQRKSEKNIGVDDSPVKVRPPGFHQNP